MVFSKSMMSLEFYTDWP